MFARKSLRLINYDYAKEGAYFVTICVNQREHVFGEIEQGNLKISLSGIIAEKYWNTIPNIYSNIELDQYVIMPNHIHGIIIIENLDVGAVINRPNDRAIDNRPYGQLSQIIKSYKQIVSKQIHNQTNIYFEWQRSFYDHIIRNDEDLQRIREYIIHNPLNWEFDDENVSKRF